MAKRRWEERLICEGAGHHSGHAIEATPARRACISEGLMWLNNERHCRRRNPPNSTCRIAVLPLATCAN